MSDTLVQGNGKGLFALFTGKVSTVKIPAIAIASLEFLYQILLKNHG